MYSYKKDPLYPTAILTIREIEISQNRAQKLRAHAFMNFINGLYEKKAGTTNENAVQVQATYASGAAKQFGMTFEIDNLC